MSGRTMTLDLASVRESVAEIVVEELELEEGELSPEGDFAEEYDGDSLALITVVARIEKELGVKVPSEALAELTNLRLLSEAVVRYAEDSGA
ncbi:acyl carrier protein [Nocardiopsis terrae]